MGCGKPEYHTEGGVAVWWPPQWLLELFCRQSCKVAVVRVFAGVVRHPREGDRRGEGRGSLDIVGEVHSGYTFCQFFISLLGKGHVIFEVASHLHQSNTIYYCSIKLIISVFCF